MAKKLSRKTASRGDAQYMLRMPPEMRDAIAKLADANGRSINTEIIAAIAEHLTRPDRLAAVEKFIEDHRDNIVALPELYGQVEEIQDMARSHDESLYPLKYERD